MILLCGNILSLWTTTWHNYSQFSITDPVPFPPFSLCIGPPTESTVVSLCLCSLAIDASDWRLGSDFEVEVDQEDTIGGGWAPRRATS